MNDSYIAYELVNNINSSQAIEKPLQKWSISILLPMIIILFGNIISMCMPLIYISSLSIISFLMVAIGSIIYIVVSIYYYRNLYFRALRVDQYISKKQYFYQLIADYYIQNKVDTNQKYCFELLYNISIFKTLNKRICNIFQVYLLFTIFTPVVPQIIFYMAPTVSIMYALFYIFNVIVRIYYVYSENNIWRNIFNIEKEIYQSFYQSLDKYQQSIVISSIPVSNNNFIVNIILTILTFGLYFLYWDYKIHIAPDKTFPYMQKIEEDIYNMFMAKINSELNNDMIIDISV